MHIELLNPIFVRLLVDVIEAPLPRRGRREVYGVPSRSRERLDELISVLRVKVLGHLRADD